MTDNTRSKSNRDEPEPNTATERSLEDVLRSDGGTTTSPFETTAEVEETRWDRYGRLYTSYIYAPFAIIRNDFRAKLGFAILAVYVVMILMAIFVVEPTSTFDGDPYMQPFETWDHPLGTDQTGRDLYSQTVRSTIPLGKMMLAGTLFTISLGTAVGVVSGYKAGAVDKILSTVTDVFINLPGLPLVIVLAVLFDPQNAYLLGILLSVATWAGLARAIRSQVLTLREESFVEAARAMDIPISVILTKEILPHIMPYVMVNAANAARNIIFAAVGLYFIGVLPYTGDNWGNMLNEAYSANAYVRPEAYHWFVIPLVAICAVSVGLVLLAQSLDRVFNPRVRARHSTRADIEDDEGSTTVETMKVQ